MSGSTIFPDRQRSDLLYLLFIGVTAAMMIKVTATMITTLTASVIMCTST